MSNLRDAGEYKDRMEELRANRVINRPIPKLDNDIVPRKNNSGRKRKYTPMRMKNNVNRYFKWCEDTDTLPSISGMMIHMKLYKEAFYTYIKSPKYTDILEQARIVIKNWVENDIYTSGGRTDGKIAYMKNVHAWADKLETNAVIEHKQISVAEARSKIEMLAPMLLEVLKSPTAVNQIAAVEAEIVEEKSARS